MVVQARVPDPNMLAQNSPDRSLLEFCGARHVHRPGEVVRRHGTNGGRNGAALPIKASVVAAYEGRHAQERRPERVGPAAAARCTSLSACYCYSSRESYTH